MEGAMEEREGGISVRREPNLFFSPDKYGLVVVGLLARSPNSSASIHLTVGALGDDVRMRRMILRQHLLFEGISTKL